MLDLKKVLTAKPKAHGEAKLTPLKTEWGDALNRQNPLPEHPLPQARRDGWASLNGVWDCAFMDAPDLWSRECATSAPSSAGVGADSDQGQFGDEATDALPTRLAAMTPPTAGDDAWREIVVPFSPEALLSGIGQQLKPDQVLWYQREFDAPVAPAGWQVTLHFMAVDYACAVWLNGRLLGTHAGGYLPFAFSLGSVREEGLPISSGSAQGEGLLRPMGNVLTLCVADPTERGGQQRGKQRLSRGDIWYTGQSGIWQSVWLEWMPSLHVAAFSLDASLSQQRLLVKMAADDTPGLRVSILDAEGTEVASAIYGQGEGSALCDILEIGVTDPHPWSPDDPYLYRVELRRGDDVVHSYCGFRDVEVRPDATGTPRVLLNGQPVFLKGVLDQGYWPDGLMTAPSDEALVFDIKQAQAAGFNMLRKHIKVESARWYYHCDRLGMLVWQDMVSGGDVWNTWSVSYKPTLFKTSWDHYSDITVAHQRKLLAGSPRFQREWTDAMGATIDLLRSHPSIITWVLFNEGWGQFDARAALATARKADATRPIDAVSGWYDQHCGDFKSVHNYFRPLEVWPDKPSHAKAPDGADGRRAFVISEFGGYSLPCDGHTSLTDAYGYSNYEGPEDWRRDVRQLLAHMDGLEAQGLAGYVYTQLSDVEEEVNGLLTYDRRINKLLH